MIIVILAAIAIPQYLSAVQNGYRAQAVGTMGEVRRVELMYRGASTGYDTDLSNGISVDVDADGTADITMNMPSSPHFIYTYSANGGGVGIPSLDATKGTGLTSSYRIELDSGTVTTF